MVPADQLRLNGLGYKRKVLMVKNSLEFFKATSDAWLPQFLSLEVSLLQLLKLEPYISNVGFIRAFVV